MVANFYKGDFSPTDRPSDTSFRGGCGCGRCRYIFPDWSSDAGSRGFVSYLRNLSIAVCFALLLWGCDEFQLKGLIVPTSATVETRFDNSMSWNKARPDYFTINVPSDDYVVYVCGDVHTDKTTENINKFLTAELNDDKAHFSIFLGDMIKDKGGMQILYDDIYSTPVLYEPMYVVAGNHDLYFNLWESFYKLFGSSTYALTVNTPNAKDLYVFLDNASGTFGISQLNWLRELLQKEKGTFRHCVISAHVNIFRDNRPFSEIANLPIDETFEFCDILADADVDIMLQGHEHYRAFTQYRGVDFLTLDAIADWFDKSSYVILSLDEDVTYEFVEVR